MVGVSYLCDGLPTDRTSISPRIRLLLPLEEHQPYPWVLSHLDRSS